MFSKTRGGFLGHTQATLSELQDLGAHAARAAGATLEKLTQTPVQVRRVDVTLVPRDRTNAVLAHHNDKHIGAAFPIGGRAPGAVATLFQHDDAHELVALLLGKEAGSVKKIGELEESAVAEMTNIALNGAITAIATQGGVRFDTGVPSVETAPLDVPMLMGYDAGPEYDHVAIVEATFHETSRDITGTLLFAFGIRADASG